MHFLFNILVSLYTWLYFNYKYYYFLGGTDGSIIHHSCELYDIKTDSWTTVSSMVSVRMTHMLVSNNSKLYAIGGNDGSGSLNSVEEYFPGDDEWKSKKATSLRRSHVGAAFLQTDSPFSTNVEDTQD